MTSPLVYMFAGVGCVLFAWFLFAGWLAFRHARTRGERAPNLESFIVTSGSRMRSAQVSELGKAQKQHAGAMQVTIGDLIRDESLLKAAGDGVAARRKAMKSNQPKPAPPEQQN